MTVLSKSERVEVRGIEEALEYVRTAMKQGYQDIHIKKGAMSSYEIAINDDQRRQK